MERRNLWGIWGGVLLIGLGIVFLLSQFLRIDIWRYVWPFFILASGAAFFVGMIRGGREAGGLAVPGSIFTMLGLVLLAQSVFGIWGAWAYAWGLIIAATGVGLFIFGSWSGLPDLRRVGWVLFAVGLVLFFVFGILIELAAALFHLRSPGGLFWPVVLILAGLYLLVARPLLLQNAGPVGRSVLGFKSVNQAGAPEAGAFPGVDVLASGQMNGVRRIVFRSFGDLTVVQGEREALEIEASQAFRERVRAEMRGDTLDIHLDDDWWAWVNPQYWGNYQARYTLYLREIDSLKVAGAGNVVAPELSTTRLELVQSGVGNLVVRKLNAEVLFVRQAGLGNIEVNGFAGNQEIELAGAGSYQANKLECRSAQVRLSGLGNATLWVTEELNAVLSGAGNIEYMGNPQVTQRVSGLGKIQKVGG